MIHNVVLVIGVKQNELVIYIYTFVSGSFLCAVLDLSGILFSLLIPEYSGIKRRGKPLPRAEESGHFLH